MIHSLSIESGNIFIKFKANLLLIFLLCYGQLSSAQHDIATKIKEQKDASVVFNHVALFEVVNPDLDTREPISTILQEAIYLDYNQEEAAQIISTKPENIQFVIPVPNQNNLVLELGLVNFITPEFSIVTSSGLVLTEAPEAGLHYQGIISGDSLSVCAISIFKDEVIGIISSPDSGNFIIGKLQDHITGMHVLYNDRKMLMTPMIDCETTNNLEGYTEEELQHPSMINVNCIRLYWEINFDIYSGQGGLTNTTNYVLGLFNQTSALYNNDGIPVQLSQLYIWDTTSPYNATSSSGLLNQFQATRTTFAGDLGHLLGYSGSGGVAASTSGLCASNIRYSQCYSGVSASYQTVPLYSWTVEVVTHEQGHLMGSRHTHGCVWNGNNTAIDNCGPTAGYPYEGSCGGAPTPPSGGTIMSYCHLTGTGISFANGFGTQPTAVILNKYNSAACLTPCTGGSFCGACSNLLSSNITTTSVNLSWTSAINASSYTIQYRLAGTSVWTTDTTSNTNFSITGLQPGSNYEWQVQTMCSGSTSLFSSSAFFITVPLVCGIPSGQTVTSISSVSANINWTPVPAAIRYIINYKVVTSGVWLTDSTTNTFFTLRYLSANTSYEWRVQTVCAGEGTSGFSNSNFFTTQNAGSPITISIQLDTECGKDAYIVSNQTTGDDYRNFGSSPEMNALAWTNSGNQVTHRSLLQFDLSFIPRNSGIQSARLSLFWDPSSSNIGHSTLSGTNEGILKKIIQPWEEYTVTWINQPSSSLVNAALLPASTSANQNYLNIDVRDIIQDFVDVPENNYGMILQLVSESPYRSLIFASSDNPDATVRPVLELTYLPNIESCLTYQYSNCYGTDAVIGNSVIAGYDTSNFGYSPEIDAVAWTNGGQRSDIRSLVYWNLSEIPSNAIVTQANLSLYWNPSSSNPGHSTQSGPNDGSLIRISSQWNENIVRWNNQPSLDSTVTAILPASTSPQQDYIVDVTSLVQQMVTNPSTNFGMMLKLNNENQFRTLTFCSSDYPDPARHPKIEVCYSIPTNLNGIEYEKDFLVSQISGADLLYVQSKYSFMPGTNLSIYTCDGKLIDYFQELVGNTHYFNTSYMSAGVYFVTMDFGASRITKKFVLIN